MLMHLKLTMCILCMLKHVARGLEHVTLLPGKVQSDLGRWADSHLALRQISGYLCVVKIHAPS